MDPPQKKKPRKDAGDSAPQQYGVIVAEILLDLGTDEVANILSFLPLQKIMCLRRVNMTWKEAARKTIVPITSDNRSMYFRVKSVADYNAMRVMTTELPNLQQIRIGDLGYRHKYSEGGNPNPVRLVRTPHDIEIISNFSKLRILEIDNVLNGRYPFLFSSFPLLRSLIISSADLKWDLDMLAGFPLLTELKCWSNFCLTGNISSLRVLKDRLEKVIIHCCPNVEGNLMDLADFPHLKQLDLHKTAVTGDIRDIGCNDFSQMEYLDLPKSVNGATYCEFQRISDGPALAAAVYLLQKRIPTLFEDDDWYIALSRHSPDWYESPDGSDTPPFDIIFVQAGCRVGYRWESENGKPCEVNWLDPEPDKESSDYEEYIEESQKIDSQVSFFRGFHQPPTEEEYNRLLQRIADENIDLLGRLG
jgi:hypothetical protein